LKTKRRYERPLNLRYKTLRNAHKRKRDRRHNPRKIRFQLKGGQENTTDKEIEMSEIKKKDIQSPINNVIDKETMPLSMSDEDLQKPLLKKETLVSNEKSKALESIEKLKKVTNKIKTSKKEDDKSPQISMSDFKGLLEQNRQRLFDNGKQDEQKDGEEVDEQKDGEEDNKQKDGEEDNKQQVGEEDDEQKDGEEDDEQQVGEEDDEQKDDDKQVVEPQKDSEQVVEPVRTTMSTDENDEYKIITLKLYYPKQAISNVKMDNGNSATQTLNLLTKG